MSNSLGYEPGMRITFDRAARKITIAFRGKIRSFPTMFDNEDLARHAAEAWCRSQGWKPTSADAVVRSLLTHLKNPSSHV